jgi:hypothetical protein
MMVVEVETAKAFSFGPPRVIFEGTYAFTGPDRSYDVSNDGRRFLMLKEQAQATSSSLPPPFVVVQNWIQELVPGATAGR